MANKLTKVAMYMLHGGDCAYVWFNSLEEATKFVGDWATRQAERIAGGRLEEVESGIYSNTCNGVAAWAVVAKYVIGMTVLQDNTPQMRLTEAQTKFLEQLAKQAGEGEEWRDVNDEG